MEITGLRKTVRSVDPYVPGKSIEEVKRELGLTTVIKLASNENNYAPFPHALKAMERELGNLNRYTDVTFKEIKHLLADLHDTSPRHIALSHGTEGMLQTIAKCFLEDGDEVILPAITYGLYREISKLMGARIVEVPMQEFQIDIEAIINALTPKTKLIWLANPNNPTGTIVPKHQLLDLLDAMPDHTWIALDEAYAEFASPDLLPDRVALIHAEKRLIVTRTFSKAYGLAGARLGYAIAHPDMITVIDTVSEPFNANRIALAGAIAVLTEDHHAYQHALTHIIRDRQRVERALRQMGMHVIPSHTNFVFFETPYDAQQLARALLLQGYIVRPCNFWGLPNTLRVTIGTTEQMDEFLEVFQELLTPHKAPTLLQEEPLRAGTYERLEI
ncbi:histidinol-phosphate transaminase [candidate division KSB3 bacterium]|uniref:Histidinol-phosphate aminotransferase n=1 Tax=candidate division KSB3 bacterium TaxID=2044937 RepID=A0A9D5Q4K7_9BACT|nr:histidinol-phosphate transaminase [candidate division KSB3 bacterium]MBD3323026.1 histidinol-phosphate transaminase [candidate division KSB3 bacterium]